MAAGKAERAVHRLLDMVVEEVSLVDRAANQHRFLIVKRSEPMDQDTAAAADTTETPPNDGHHDTEPAPPDTDETVVDLNELPDDDSDEVVETKALDGSPSALILATQALEALTEAVEVLGTVSEEEARARVASMALARCRRSRRTSHNEGLRSLREVSIAGNHFEFPACPQTRNPATHAEPQSTIPASQSQIARPWRPNPARPQNARRPVPGRTAPPRSAPPSVRAFRPRSGPPRRELLSSGMEQMTRELLRALRGERSQVAFARRLGYKGNPIADWEAGRRFPTALEMLRAYEKVSGDVAGAFARFHPSTPARLADGTLDLASWLSALRGSASAQDIAARAKLSRHQVSRWLRGQTQPRVPDFLRVLEAITGVPRISSRSSCRSSVCRRRAATGRAGRQRARSRMRNRGRRRSCG